MDGKNRGKKYIAVLIFSEQKGCNGGGIRVGGDGRNTGNGIKKEGYKFPAL